MKARIISAVLVLAACFVLIYAAGSVSAGEKQVNITERSIFGDSAYADGIELGCGGFAGDSGSYRLAWESSYKFAEKGGEAEQETSFVKYKAAELKITESSYLQIESEPAIPTVLDIIEDGAAYEREGGRTAELMREIFTADAAENAAKLKAKCTKSTNNEIAVYLKDFLRYYPVNLSIYDGGTGKFLQFEDISNIGTENEESFAQLNRFFRIPVLEKQRSFYSFDLASNGKINFFMDFGNVNESGSDFTEEAFELYMRGYDTGTAFYMLFDAHIEYPADTASERADAVVDTSLIPGGYGIYRLPYGSQNGELSIGEPETVYSLDPKNYNEIVSISPDGENMLITVSDGKSIHAELISLKDMKAVQRIELPIFSGKTAAAENGLLKYVGHREVELTEGGSEAATLFYTNGCYCLLSYENGRYKSELSFTADEMNMGNETESLYSLGILGSLDSDASIRLAYDGSRLAVLGCCDILDQLCEFNSYENLTRYLRYSCALDVAVADSEGLRYYGRLDTNLSDFGESQNDSSLDGLDGNDEFFSDAPYSLTQPQREKLWIRL